MHRMTDIKAREGSNASINLLVMGFFDDQTSQTKGEKREKS